MDEQEFRDFLLDQVRITSPSRQATLWEIAQHCARNLGIPMAGAGLVMGARAVSVPAVVAGVLGGLAAGTMLCTAVSYWEREQIKQFADDL